MKASGNNIGRLVVGCFLACSLTLKLNAQTTATNGPNTGLTAAQIAARQAAEEAQLQTLMQAMAQTQAAQKTRLKPAAGQSGAQQSLIIGGQQDDFSENYAPWLQPVWAVGSDGVTPRSLDDINAASCAAALQEAALKQR